MKYGRVRKYRKAIRELRSFCKKHIIQRIKDMENGEQVPNDSLTIMINESSNGCFSLKPRLLLNFIETI